MSAFGSFGAPAKPATSFAGFGTPASAPPPAQSLFGAPAQPTSLFGQPQQQAQPGLFGAPATPSPFGAPQPQAAGGLFGASAAPAAGGLFGASQAPAAGGLFGAPPAAGGLFGASQAPAAGGLFGASQPAAAGGLFGAAPAPGGLFGAQAKAPSLFGGFGASQPAAAPGLFGAAQPQPSLLGQPQQQAPAVTAAPLFGQSQSAASASLFGTKSATNPFGSSTAAQPSLPLPKLGDPYPPPNPNEAIIESRIEALMNAWDPSTVGCRFQTYFYNVPTPPLTVEHYGQPPPGADAKAWAKAVRENPDPDHLVPAIAIGFPAIQKRIDGQVRQSQAHQARLTEIHDHLATLASTHTLTTSLRTLRASQNATALSARLLSIVAKVSALSPNRNMSVRKEEEELRVGLEAMMGLVEGTKGRGNELWAGVGALKARKGENGTTEWAVADEEGLRKILEILTTQQAGLDHLTRTLNSASADVEVMNEAFGLSSKHAASPSKTRAGR